MKNYFEIFNLAVDFNIDLAQLEKNYLQLQQQHHPDQNHISVDSIEYSILINQGYKILSDNLSRAIHLLQLKQIDIEDDDNPIKPDISTLQEVLDLQEKINEITNLSQISELKKDVNIDIDFLIKKFCEHYRNNDLTTATQLLIKAKYLKKTAQDLKNKEKTLR